MKKQKPKIEWHVKRMKVEDLIPAEDNPHIMTIHMYKKLKNSIVERGIFVLPLINTDNTIIGGHQRKQAFLELGIEEVNCLVPDKKLDSRQFQLAMLESNKITGDWDWDILANIFDREILLEAGFVEPEIKFQDVDISGNEEAEIEDQEEKDVKFTITIPDEDSTSFENQLDDVLKGFSRAKKKKK
jgi:ParB-like chromosome segregation protein Spo0J